MTAPRHIAAGALAGLALLACLCSWGCDPVAEAHEEAGRVARIDPDYADTVIPPNIAPLNFTVREKGSEYLVEVGGAGTARIRVSSSDGGIRLPAKPWRELLQQSRGAAIHFDVYVRQEGGGWLRFDRVTNRVAPHQVDGHLAYRLLKPLYNKYVNIGIYQRDLATYEETAVLDNRDADRACLNCHTFPANRPDPFLLHTRSRHGLTMLVSRGDTVRAVHTRTDFNRSPAAYSSWHPSKKAVAFSVNKVSLFFHTVGETRDVFDAASDLAVYAVDANILTTTAAISRPDSAEVWPSWSPDGRHLYFASAPILPPERFREVRYSLMRIGYDVESGAWGQLETVLSAQDVGQSLTQPRLSPDGRYLLFTAAAYGSFPVYLESSDLYLMDLQSGAYERLDTNSDQADSWHCWSSNGRWFAFSSKRRNGLMARPFFSYFDEQGRAHKPFLLPQEDPAFYDSFIKTYNVPELITGPVAATSRQLGRAVVSPAHPVTARLDPRVLESLQSR